MRSTKVATAVSASAVIVLLSISCASSSLGKGLDIAVAGSGIADYTSTRAAINAGKGREGNPLAGHSAWRQVLVKSAGVSTVIGVSALADLEGKKTLAWILRCAAIAVNSGLSVRNYRIARR